MALMCRLMVSIHFPHEILAVESILTSLFGYLSLQLIGKSLADLQGPESNFDILHRAIISTYRQQNENLIHTTLYGLDGKRSSLNVSCTPCAPNGWDRCFISFYPNSASASPESNHYRPNPRSDTSSDRSSTNETTGAPKNQRRRGARPVPPPLVVDDGYVRRLRRRLRADERRAAAAADVLATPPPPTRSASPGTDPGAGAAQTPQRKPGAPLAEQAPRRSDLPDPAALHGEACGRSLGREPWEGGGPLGNPSCALDESHGSWPVAAAAEEPASPRLHGDADWLGWADGPADLRGGAPGWPDSVWARIGGEGLP